jgi:peptidoglycan-N-acetylglucosamine deacetylase
VPFRVALTFDAEHPDRPAQHGRQEQVLNELDRFEVDATFFLQGRWVEAYPELARRVAARHLVGSHSHYHARMPLFSAEGLRADLAAAEDAIRDATDVDPHPWFRCPFGTGADQAALVGSLAALGYRHVGWHVEAFEWAHGATVDSVTEAVVSGALAHGDGAVVLLHPWPDPVAPAMPSIVERLRAAGAVFVKVDQLDLPAGLEPIGDPHPGMSGAAAR